MKLSIKAKLIIMFFIVIAVPMIILGSLSYKWAANSLQDTIEEQLKQKTNDTANLINKSIESVESSIEIASLDADILNALKNPKEEEINYAFDYIKKVQKNNEAFMEVLILTDSTGKIIVDTEAENTNLNLNDRDYMKESLNGGQVVVSDVLTSRITGNPAIFIVYPIKEADEIIGTIVGGIKFDSISNYTNQIKIGEKGYAYMIDKNALIINHPDKNKILKENLNDTASGEFKLIVEEMKQGKTSEGFYTYDNVYKYVAFQPVNNWVVAITADYDEYMSSANRIRNDTIIIVIISIIVAMIWAYIYLEISISKPIKKLKDLMKLAGDGDLTVKSDIKSNDEIGELSNSFNNMISHQEKMVKNIIVSSEQLNDASEQMASSLEEISATTEEVSATVSNVAEDSGKQNQSIINVSEMLVELSSLVKLAQNRAESASSNAVNSKQVADLGRAKVQQTVKAINNISRESNDTFKVLESVNILSVKVGGIVNTINSIAEQTDLLALNAAIEAARAGEHGRGFSVVAEEVRKLSEESNEKAKEIAILIDEMIKQIKNAVNAMQRANDEVKNGVEIVSETDEAFINIISSIEIIVKHISEILDITSNEVASSDKVIQLIDDVATIAENNNENCKNVSLAIQDEANVINNLTATAEETSAMSDELIKIVEEFKI